MGRHTQREKNLARLTQSARLPVQPRDRAAVRPNLGSMSEAEDRHHTDQGAPPFDRSPVPCPERRLRGALDRRSLAKEIEARQRNTATKSAVTGDHHASSSMRIPIPDVLASCACLVDESLGGLLLISLGPHGVDRFGNCESFPPSRARRGRVLLVRRNTLAEKSQNRIMSGHTFWSSRLLGQHLKTPADLRGGRTVGLSVVAVMWPKSRTTGQTATRKVTSPSMCVTTRTFL
jgi:hypothetical protein